MISRLVIERLAVQCGLDWVGDFGSQFPIPLESLEAFTQAVIAEYVAGLEPVGEVSNLNNGLGVLYRRMHSWQPLYALETK